MNDRQFKDILTNLDTGIIYEMEESVWGFENMEIKHYRHDVYNTVLFEASTPQRFMRSDDLGAYMFLLEAYEAKGVKARVTREIKELNSFTNNYETYYIGELDFTINSGFEIDVDYITIKSKDSSKLSKFLTRDEIDVNVFSRESIDGVLMPSLPTFNAFYLPIDIYLYAYTSSNLGITDTFLSGVNRNVYYADESPSVNLLGDRYQGNDIGNNKVYDNNTGDSIFVKSKTSGSYSFNITFAATGNLTIKATLVYKNSVGTVVYSQQLFSQTMSRSSAGAPQNIQRSGSFSGEINQEVVSGGSIELVANYSLTTTGTVSVITNIPTILDIIEIREGSPTSRVKGMLPHELVSKFVQLYTSETDNNKLIESTVLGRPDSQFQTYPDYGDLCLQFCTNGWQLRGYTERALNMSFRDWFLSQPIPLGMWYDKNNDKFILEKVSEFYKLEQFPIHLGDVEGLKITPAQDYYYNNILSGYPKVEYDEFQAANEFNSETEHSISIETKKTKSIRSKYYGDSIGQELARRKSKLISDSSDTKFDNNVYITTLDVTLTTIQGYLSNLSGFIGIEQYYNTEKTPRQILINYSELLQPPLFKEPTEDFAFRSSKKDINIKYTDPTEGVLVNEFDNIPQLKTPLVYPELYKFTALYNKEIRDAIQSDPHRYWAFYDIDGNEKYGYIQEISGSPFGGTAEYTLIRLNESRL